MNEGIESTVARLNSDITYAATTSSALVDVGINSAEHTVDAALDAYRQAQEIVDVFNAVKDAAKALIQDVMEKTGQTSYTTATGKASLTTASSSVSYDSKALDILIRDDADLAMRLAPYRKESQRAGSLRITAK